MTTTTRFPAHFTATFAACTAPEQTFGDRHADSLHTNSTTGRADAVTCPRCLRLMANRTQRAVNEVSRLANSFRVVVLIDGKPNAQTQQDMDAIDAALQVIANHYGLTRNAQS